MLLQPVDGMIRALQLHFSKDGMYFIVTDLVQQDGGCATAAFA